MSTNQLFRDYLDGKIHVRKPFKAGAIYTAPVGQFLKSDDATGWMELNPAGTHGYILDESHDWIDQAHDWRQGGIDRMNTVREVSVTIPIVWPRGFGKSIERIIERESQVNEMLALHGCNFDPSAKYDMPDSERHDFNWRVSQIWKVTGQSAEEIADLLHEFVGGGFIHTPTAPDLDRAAKAATTPRHGPAQPQSWRGRERAIKYRQR